MVCWRVLRGCNARHFLILLIPLLIAAFLSPLQVVQAAAITVNSLADASVSGNGQCTLREAIANANSNTDSSGGDCGAGSGTDTITFSLNGTITLASTLPNITSVMTIDGTGHTVAISGNNAVQVLHIASGGNLTVNALTIQNGNAGQYYGDRGGGIFNQSGILTITNSTFSGNFANQGGAIATEYTSGATSISGTTFSSNSGSSGGAIYVFNSIVSLSNISFSGNSAYDGGAIYNWGTVNLSNSIISNNTASEVGGGIYNYGTLTVTNSTLSGNTATTNGGAIYNYSSSLVMTKSTLSGNSAVNGGGLYTTYGVDTLTHNTLSGNSASATGGSIYNIGGDLTLTANTIANNSAVTAGGVYAGGSITTNVYLAGNIFKKSAAGTNCALINVDDNGYNISDDASCAFFSYLGDPETSQNNTTLNLSGLASNDGGSTQTQLPASGSFSIAHIPYGTVVDNNGVSLACNGSVTDQNGISRPRILSGACSAGAVEATAAVITCPAPSVITTTSQLSNCILWANAYPGTADLTLTANITLSAELPIINSEVVLNGGGFALDGSDNKRVLLNTGNLTLNAITVRNGFATSGGGIFNTGSLTMGNSSVTSSSASIAGGGICNYNGTLVINNGTISANASTGGYAGGGGIYTFDGTVTLTGTIVSNNSAVVRGGGLSADGLSYDGINSVVTLTDSTFSANTTDGDGGAIYDFDQIITATGEVFSDNTANRYGGAVFIELGNVSFDSSSWNGNVAVEGGAILNKSTLTVNRSTLSGNVANYGGAILSTDTLTLLNSTVYNNQATVSGGGIYNKFQTARVQNSTLSSNSATYGANGFTEGTLILTNDTLTGSSSANGSLFIYGGSVHLAGTLLDTGTSGPNCFIQSGATYDYGYNLSDDNSCGFASPGSAKNIPLNLGPLQNNGGPTLTHMPGAGSPAIDRIPHGTFIINNGVVYACNQTGQAMDTDQRGQPRPAVAGTACDSGAVEVATLPPSPEIVVEAPGPVNIADGGTYNLGTTSVAIPLSRILTVRNTGNAALNLLTNPPATTGGFTTGNLGSVSLAPGASTTFSLTCPATTAGNPVSGSVSFANDDSDENPFNFTVTCVVTETPANAAPPLNYGTSSTVTLSWNMVSGALEYQLQVDDSLTFTPLLTYTVIVPGNTLSIVTPALPDGLYYWRVQAKQPNGTWGGWSEIQSFVIATS